MDHVASVPSAASGRMSPEAVGLAVVLHAALALALWALAAYRPIIELPEEPIEITIEKPKPPEPPPPPPPQQAQPKPLPPPPVEGLRPPAEITADKPTQVRPSGEAPKDVAAPPPRSLEQAAPQPPTPPSPPPPETAMVAPSPPSPVPPPDRPMLQPFPKPTLGPSIEPPPPTTPRPPETPPPAVARPQPQPTPPPPAPVTPHQQPRPSPLVAPHPQSEPPAVARHQEVPTPPSSPFVNPADEHTRATAEQNYLWEVVRKLRGYRYHADVPLMEGLTVVQVVIARDGRLLDAQVVRSSGVPAMDQGVLAGIRQGSPYARLPESLSGPSARFRLPLVSVPEGR
ncbi:MAG: energy transducer TonB [Alphaproteobacteria bacterium]|nr:MAG: energy transducer TonB [Alphaproteobacteria bacterium]